MDKTTMYLPPDLKARLRRAAASRGVSEAEIIRQALRAAVDEERPAPRGGLFESSAPIARDADEHLRGFGAR